MSKRGGFPGGMGGFGGMNINNLMKEAKKMQASMEKWMDNQEVCGILRISKRTLQVYREKGLLPFTRVKNKFFYKPEDVQNMLESSYHPQKRKP